TSLGRTCCANIAVPGFLSTFVFIVARFVDLTTNFQLYVVLKSIYVFLRAFSLQGYLFFSTLAVFLAYIGYAKPFHFQRAIISWCVAGYLWATLMTFMAFPKVMIVDIFGALSYETNFAIPMTAQALIALAMYALMMSLYVQVSLLRSFNSS
uniref:ABC2_membrane domain-containing protein n=1 Tax=Steinernema glaseri TaxID=37863 RepID=A0A1I7XZI8_9BILA